MQLLYFSQDHSREVEGNSEGEFGCCGPVKVMLARLGRVIEAGWGTCVRGMVEGTDVVNCDH